MPEPGTLYLVATPLGNRDDISLRAIETLKSVDLIACEDTRTSGKLLSHLEIDKPTLAYHEHNEKSQSEYLVNRLKGGESIALITDAGTPNISDPGFRIVRACRNDGLPVVAIPGGAACIVALAASGLPTHQFFYAGFLPPKKAARQRFFETHKNADYSLVLYESRYRIEKCVDDIEEVLGEQRVICLARELTKLHETYLVGTVESVKPKLKGVQLKGEFVVVIAPEGYTL